MKLLPAFAALIFFSGCSTVSLDSVRKVAPAQPQPYAELQMRSTVELSKIVIGLERGAVYGQLGLGLLCLPGPVLKWEGGTSSQTEGPMMDAARDAFATAGIRLAGDPTKLFNVGPDSTGELVVAAKVEKIDLKICGVNTYTGQVGASYLMVEWQVFSRSKGAVVLTVKSEGSFETKKHKPGATGWIAGAFGEATKQFLANQSVRDLLTKTNAGGKVNAV
jgi:hypothetical protein